VRVRDWLTETVRQETVFYHGGPESKWYDVNFYRDLSADSCFRALADYRLVCEHLEGQQ